MKYLKAISRAASVQIPTGVSFHLLGIDSSTVVWWVSVLVVGVLASFGGDA